MVGVALYVLYIERSVQALAHHWQIVSMCAYVRMPFHSKWITKVRSLPGTRKCLSYEGCPDGLNASDASFFDSFLYTLINL